MSLTPANIKWLHVEASTRCNAWCPSCPRNQNGFELKPGLILTDLPTARLKEILLDLPKLNGIQFCGNYGDPVIADNFLDLIDASIGKTDKIQIHTNGSLRNTQWWENLATQLKRFKLHDVWFGIDGLKGTHEIYRQATDYDKIIKNATAFINAGGHATWQFIPFKHNENEIKSCIKISQQLGFKKFKIVKSFRSEQTSARHWKTGKEFLLEPADIYVHNWALKEKNQVLEKDCMHLSQPSVYLSATGTVSPCCYLDREIADSGIPALLSSNDIKRTIEIKPLPTCLSNCGSFATTDLDQ
jgi:MoaA/NifB/PqqE/SkfB family radical SAM enzyme